MMVLVRKQRQRSVTEVLSFTHMRSSSPAQWVQPQPWLLHMPASDRVVGWYQRLCLTSQPLELSHTQSHTELCCALVLTRDGSDHFVVHYWWKQGGWNRLEESKDARRFSEDQSRDSGVWCSSTESHPGDFVAPCREEVDWADGEKHCHRSGGERDQTLMFNFIHFQITVCVEMLSCHFWFFFLSSLRLFRSWWVSLILASAQDAQAQVLGIWPVWELLTGWELW